MKINGLPPFVFVDGKLFVDVSSATGLIRFKFFFYLDSNCSHYGSAD